MAILVIGIIILIAIISAYTTTSDASSLMIGILILGGVFIGIPVITVISIIISTSTT